MRLEVRPAGPEVRWIEADIEHLQFGDGGLRIIVVYAREFGKRGKVEIAFFGRTRHRVLEEVDLAAYWSGSSFASSHLVFEVISGGWLSHDAQGEAVLSVAAVEPGAREWLVRTSNFSASVVSAAMPQVEHYP
jgi:hypothetical protein